MLILFGCQAAVQKTGPYSPPPAEVLGPSKEQELFSRLREWTDSFDNLKALVNLHLKSPAKKANMKEVIVLKKNSGLRIETLNLLGQPTMYLVSKDKDNLLIYFPFENKLKETRATKENLYQWAGVNLDLSQVIKILSATVPLSAGIKGKTRWIYTPQEKRYILQIFDEKTIREEVWLEAERFIPQRTLLFDEEGALFLDVSYTLYQSVQNRLFPYSMKIVLPAENTVIHIIYKSVSINQKLPDGIFTLPIPKKTKSLEK
jgi:outer membrane lipoprotein-sorting protein